MSVAPAEAERPRVPNHEMVRVIGRGAYGEIWMARSLTGALRAVKIVDQRTFETERAFQREFEGMARFEPISRSDAGFVDILHVGRDDGGHFFYYVMELADNATGEEVDLSEYVPKTLRTELRRRSRLLVSECLALGLSLTRALGVLHRHGLVHRDIKPANIIFVGGVPKIADIGLVAASGQDSFVGTEGYVPPEGPGTVQADLFSLGKVIYEMAMGKDRLDFPALHSDITRLPEKDELMRLNALLLKACAPDPRDRYASAEAMHEDLERIREGRPLARRRRGPAPLLGATVAVALVGAFGLWKEGRRPGSVAIESEPPGAMVVIKDGGSIHRSPARFGNLSGGRHVARVMLPGFDAVEVPFDVAPGRETALPAVRLSRSRGGLQLSSAPEGAEFTVTQDGTALASGKCPAALESLPTGEYDVTFRLAGSTQQRRVEVTRGERATAEAEFAFSAVAISSDPPGAEIRVDDQPAGVAPVQVELAQGRHDVAAHYGAWPDQRQSVDVDGRQSASAAFRFLRGSVKITSAPTGATVYAGKKEIGKTPLLLEELEPGPVSYDLRLSGYKPSPLSGEVKPGEQTFLGGRLTQRPGPQPGRPWENSLQMKFAPVGAVLFGVWPVRVRDYDAFCRATGRNRLLPDFDQDPTHPAVRVNWDDAAAFCDWLTQKETHAGLLESGQMYRLPTDQEWSEAAGLPPESGSTPEERDGKLHDFPWGRQWPPPAGAGNYANGKIPGYRDAFHQTSPVGSFAPNSFGLYDMGGNVWQWVQDNYKGGGRGKDWGVLRGGSWSTSAQAEMRSSYRNVVDRAERDVIFGFRVVLTVDGGQ